MVEAFDIGELAWSVENMLNRVIDRTISVRPHLFNLIDAVIEVVPTLVTAFEQRKKNPIKEITTQYEAWASQISEGNFPDALEEPLASGGVPPAAQADSEPAENESLSVEPAESDATVEFVEPAASVDTDESIDKVLQEIFSQESDSHLETIDNFVADMERDAPLYSVPSDELQRALHTLKGSAKMAQVWPIAEITEPLEHFTKELITYQVRIDDDILQLIRDAADYTRHGLEYISLGKSVEIPKSEQFVARTQELRDLAVGHLVCLKETEETSTHTVDPRMLSIVMAEEMALLLDADQLLQRWQETGDYDQISMGNLLGELSTLEEGARLANLHSMAELSASLGDLYSKSFDHSLPVEPEFFGLMHRGHEALLDMVDAVAAGQNAVPPPQDLTDAMNAMLASAVAPEPEQEPEQEIVPAPVVDENDAAASIFGDETSADGDLSEDAELFTQDTGDQDGADEGMGSIALPDVGGSDVDSDDAISFSETDEGDEIAFEFDTAAQEDGDVSPAWPELESKDIESGADDHGAAEVEQELPVVGLDEVTSELEKEDSAPSLIAEDDHDDAEQGLTDTLFESPELNVSFDSGSDADTADVFDADDDDADAPISFESEGEEGISFVADLPGSDEPISFDADEDDASVSFDINESDDEFAGNDEVELASIATPEFSAPEPEVTESSSASATDVAGDDAELKEGIIPGLLDTIDTRDDDFDSDILEVFLEEAAELNEEIDEAIHAWESNWSDGESLDAIKRILHTLKGGARLSGLSNLGDLTHDYESLVIDLGDDMSSIDEQFFKQIHGYQDRVTSAVRAVKAFADGDYDIAVRRLDDEPAEAPAVEHVDKVEAPIEHDKDEVVKAEVSDEPEEQHGDSAQNNIVKFAPKPKDLSPEPSDANEFVMPTVSGGGGQAVSNLAMKKAGPQEVVKVNSDLLEELVNLAGETSINRSRLEQQVSDFSFQLDEVDSTLSRLQEQLRRLDIETEAQILFRQEQMEQHEEFDPLEMDRYSQLQQLSRSLIESASDLEDLKVDLSDRVRETETLLLQQSRINTTLQEGLMRSRMVPFSRLVPRLRRIVRQVATELGKNVSFELDNIEGELDRSVLERMVPPFEHMLRNAVDHGIESPENRIAAGKSETGRIVLTLSREGGDVIIRLADDGRGVDLKRVREKAIEREIIGPDADLSDHDVMQFILHAGFSTAESITQISGRGVGMDVVNAEIKQLGGAVTINSEWGKGTEFVIRLPFTLSVNRALMVGLGTDQYAVPLSSIEGIVRVSPFELEHYYANPDAKFEYANENYHVRFLGSLLSAGAAPKLEGQALPLPVLLVRSAEHTMALQVDALMGSREIVVKSLGQQFASVAGLSGATVMGDGSVVVILDPHAMVRQEIARATLQLDDDTPEQIAPVVEENRVSKIMVVDDSVTVRKVTTRFLEREGFEVITAKDGVDALRILQDGLPDLMLLDIEMPRMDGFEVAKTVRTTQRWESLPIIMITSRTGDKHRQHALSLGVNNYLGKPYQEDILLEAIGEILEDKDAQH